MIDDDTGLESAAFGAILILFILFEPRHLWPLAQDTHLFPALPVLPA